MGNAMVQEFAQGLQPVPPKKKGRTSNMVLVAGHIRKVTKKGEEPEDRRVEIWVQAEKDATVGWVLSRVIEELAKKE
ncbi:pkbA, partial [Symbiodinium sp. CCMP2456]